MIPRHQQIASVEVIRDVDPASQIDNIQIAKIKLPKSCDR